MQEVLAIAGGITLLFGAAVYIGRAIRGAYRAARKIDSMYDEAAGFGTVRDAVERLSENFELLRDDLAGVVQAVGFHELAIEERFRAVTTDIHNLRALVDRRYPMPPKE